MDDAPVQVAVVGTRIEAELIVGMLQSNGVQATIRADDAGGQQPSMQLGGVQVFVAAADETLARQLLLPDDDEPGGPDQT